VSLSALTPFVGDAALSRCLASFSGTVAVAYSGGLDSSALLFAAARLCEQQGRPLLVLHVHHGLQAAANSFATHCEVTVKQIRSASLIKLHVIRLQIALEKGDSTEERARAARYKALADLAQQHGADCVLLAQHADDQAESVLLALTRGAGLAGLSGMAARFERHGAAFARPWLGVARGDIEAWVRDNNLGFVTDPTNADERYTRNALRARVLPALQAVAPSFRASLARSAEHAAQAQALLDEYAHNSLRVLGVSYDKCAIDLVACMQLTPAQLGNALRYWLKTVHGTQASTAQLAELQAQIATSQRHGAPRKLSIKVGHGRVFRQGNALNFERI
jgi:tRNA(Ile)-lysidine synthase